MCPGVHGPGVDIKDVVLDGGSDGSAVVIVLGTKTACASQFHAYLRELKKLRGCLGN